MGGNKFRVYEMPDLQPHVPGTESVFRPQPSLLYVIHVDEDYPLQRGSMCQTEPNNGSFPGPSHCVDIIGDFGDFVPTLARFNMPADYFSVETPDQTASNSSRSIVPAFIRSVDSRQQITYNPSWTSSWCDQSRLVHNMQYSLDDRVTKVTAHLTSTDSNLSISRWGNFWRWDPEPFVTIEYGICLISGRLCIATPYEIRVVDYVKPPV
jgi:hypothetical protein